MAAHPLKADIKDVVQEHHAQTLRVVDEQKHVRDEPDHDAHHPQHLEGDHLELDEIERADEDAIAEDVAAARQKAKSREREDIEAVGANDTVKEAVGAGDGDKDGAGAGDDKKEANAAATPCAPRYVPRQPVSTKALFTSLGFFDRWLAVWVIIAMVLGVVIGVYAPDVHASFDQVRLHNVSFPIVLGLIIMMWPALTKVQYELLPTIFRSSKIWWQIGLSLILNWIVGPLVMTALAWATLPDLHAFREGVITVGLARCIAMVMIWTQLAKGDLNYCAILVLINSILQIAFFPLYLLLFVNDIGASHYSPVDLDYSPIAISVLIYLGIPLGAGAGTRLLGFAILGKERFEKRFLPYFGPLGLIGLLYTIIVLFAYQGERIIDHLGPVFRVFVPLVLYFVVMWAGTFVLVYYLSHKRGGAERFGYDMAVVQAFTAGSNNFELAIAVAIATWGVNSSQALAATIGPLVEVPVLLALTWVALYLRQRLDWKSELASLDANQRVRPEVGETVDRPNQ